MKHHDRGLLYIVSWLAAVSLLFTSSEMQILLMIKKVFLLFLQWRCKSAMSACFITVLA